jgi:hypothetical protein
MEYLSRNLESVVRQAARHFSSVVIIGPRSQCSAFLSSAVVLSGRILGTGAASVVASTPKTVTDRIAPFAYQGHNFLGDRIGDRPIAAGFENRIG